MDSVEVIELDDDGWQVIPAEIMVAGNGNASNKPISSRKGEESTHELLDQHEGDELRNGHTKRTKTEIVEIDVDENGWQVFPKSLLGIETKSNGKEQSDTTPGTSKSSPGKDLWPIFRSKDQPVLPKSSNGPAAAGAITARREFWNTPAPAAITIPTEPTLSFPSLSRAVPVPLPQSASTRPVPLPRSPPSRALTTLDPYQHRQTKPTSVIDPSWELIDPNPDIHALFLLYNATYFWDKLGTVTVEWSSKMTTCAGLCYFKRVGRFSEIRIKLSLPLLKLRPRKDLVETLLHEMIHAYLFLEPGKGDSHDRDGHGPNFQEHMHRINKASGAKITIYHSFHDEVGHYKQHWWQCNGPCRHRHPFYGMVKRAMNRAPGPSDRWWSDHGANCDGVFIKVKEPSKTENEQAKKPKMKRPATSTAAS